MKIDKISKLINLAMVVLVFFILLYLVWYDINPSGQRSIVHTYNKNNKLVRGPYPEDRLGVNNNYWQIAIDPVYFDLYIPRLYQKIDFSVEFQLSDNQTILELGGLGSDEGWQITLKPVYNFYFESLQLDCKKFAYSPSTDVSICAGRKSLPVELNNWSDILEQYPTAEYVTYNFNSFRLADINTKEWEQNFTSQDFDFLLTTYQPAQDLGNGWRQATASFLPNELWLAGHIYKFVISSPDLAQNKQTVNVRSVKFDLEKEPITQQNFTDKLFRFLNRLKNRF